MDPIQNAVGHKGIYHCTTDFYVPKKRNFKHSLQSYLHNSTKINRMWEQLPTFTLFMYQSSKFITIPYSFLEPKVDLIQLIFQIWKS